MARPADTRNAGRTRPDAPAAQPVTQRKGWPFAQGSQNHLDETSAPWPRPIRQAPAKPAGSAKPDQ
jgi:hypothetical protein